MALWESHKNWEQSLKKKSIACAKDSFAGSGFLPKKEKTKQVQTDKSVFPW